MLGRLLGLSPSPNRLLAESLYGRIVAAARQPAFYAQWEVPDTPLGRFEMLGLHVFLFLGRVRGEGEPLAGLAQELTDVFFAEVDHSLRELGIGDLGIPKRMKTLARMFYGRAASYGAALDAGDVAALAEALRRNIRPEASSWPEARALAGYVVRARSELAAQDAAVLLAGAIAFPDAEAMAR